MLSNLVLSANSYTRQNFIALYESVIYIRNSKDPRTELCGTPYLSVEVLDLKPLTDTYCFLLHR